MLRFKRVGENARAPVLAPVEAVILPAGKSCLVSTDLQIILPEGCYGRLAPRSGLAVRSMIDIGAGVIDPDYQGVVKVLVYNFGDQDFVVNIGDRIVQLVCERYVLPRICEFSEDPEKTERGVAGFGSTGDQ